VSQNLTALTIRDDDEPCYYGNRLEYSDYFFYLDTDYNSQLDKILLYSGKSVDQLKAFQQVTPGYLGYDDVFTFKPGNPYALRWPLDENGCYRPDDAEASSRALAAVVTGDVLIFGAVKWQDYPNSFFSDKEIPELRRALDSGRLSKLTHMIRGATDPSQVLATDDSYGHITYVEGQEPGTPNSSGGE
jgi:hypothetical protein